jgi:transposase
MATPLLPDALWDLIEPLLPTPASKLKGGRPRLSDRACLKGVLFVLRSGIPWRMLPQEMNCGSGMSCWRRLRDWVAGVLVTVTSFSPPSLHLERSARGTHERSRC